MAKREPVTMYFSEEEKEAIQKEAAAEDKTVSAYCRDIIQDYRFERRAEDLDAEERLKYLLDEGIDQMEEIAEDVRRQNQRIVNLLEDAEAEGVDVDDDTADDFHDRISDDDGGGV